MQCRGGAAHGSENRAVQALQDADVRESYTHFLRFRDGLLAAGTLEAYYLSLFPRNGLQACPINIPPLFIALLVQAVTRHMLDNDAQAPGDVYSLRASDVLFRSQRISLQNGQVLSGDQSTLDMLSETGGLGDMGRFLAEARAPLHTLALQVLTDDNAPGFLDDWQKQRSQGRRHRFLLDLTHEVSNDLSHGLVLTMTRSRSGLKALANVLQRWVQHFLGIAVTICPLQKIDDVAWRWHVGLDAGASALVPVLYSLGMLQKSSFLNTAPAKLDAAVTTAVALWLKIANYAFFQPESSMSKKIRVEADICAPKPVPPKGFTPSSGHGQKVSLERGTSTRSKKNPGKRPKKGG